MSPNSRTGVYPSRVVPQIVQSGPDKPFNLVAAKEKPEKTRKPEDKGKPGEEEAEELEFEGVIETIDNNTWTMTIEGQDGGHQRCRH